MSIIAGRSIPARPSLPQWSRRCGPLFSAVAPYDGHDRSDFLMTGRLEKLDAIDYGVKSGQKRSCREC